MTGRVCKLRTGRPKGAFLPQASCSLAVSEEAASDTTSTDVPSVDLGPLQEAPPIQSAAAAAAAGFAVDESALRTRHRTCADVAPAHVDTLVIKRLAAGLREAELLRLLGCRGPACSGTLSAKLLQGPTGSFSGTAFVRFATPEAAQAALKELGTRPRLGGRRVHVEPQKTKALLGGRELETILSDEELYVVRQELDNFLYDAMTKEAALPSTLSAPQRKYLHSLAEQHGLGHASRQGPDGETYVHLTKASTTKSLAGATKDFFGGGKLACHLGEGSAAAAALPLRVARPPPGLVAPDTGAHWPLARQHQPPSQVP